ncbi:hypothetical protein GGR50DRAFT_233336 [Xylaria sp. CBS 124048]|nr:hypothetical protein GGR50DRAFT_233336 [Xylaria sp. CBS 124048]
MRLLVQLLTTQVSYASFPQSHGERIGGYKLSQTIPMQGVLQDSFFQPFIILVLGSVRLLFLFLKGSVLLIRCPHRSASCLGDPSDTGTILNHINLY